MHSHAEHAQSPFPVDSGPPPRAKGLSNAWIAAIVGGGCLIMFMTLATSVFIFAAVLISGGAKPVVGTWIRTDRPPSRAARALMSVGNEIVADRMITLSALGSASVKNYPGQAPMQGSWRMAPEQNGNEDEITILIEFPNNPSMRVHILHIDHETAMFRVHGSYGEQYSRVR